MTIQTHCRRCGTPYEAIRADIVRGDWEYHIPGNTQRLAAANVIPFTWADTPDGSPYRLPTLATGGSTCSASDLVPHRSRVQNRDKSVATDRHQTAISLVTS